LFFGFFNFNKISGNSYMRRLFFYRIAKCFNDYDETFLKVFMIFEINLKIKTYYLFELNVM